MKLTIALIIFAVLTIHAKTYSQQTKLSFSFHQTSVADVLNYIEDKSEFYFFYKENELHADRLIDLNVSNEDIYQILDKILNGTGLNYSVVDRYIVIGDENLNNSSSFLSVQQVLTVSGKVTNPLGESIPGVTVIVKGTTQGTISDADGIYSLSNVPDDATLVFSFVGMKTQEIPVENKSVINVTMAEESIGIEEVVAIGYGTIKKSDLTGSIATVQGELVANRQTLQLSHALQGASSGIMVTTNGNKPGTDATIRIRGITTINDSDPLYIIDGVAGSIDDINPQDIENISILKDAASASIYGSRAASGVILIETRRAKIGASSLNYEVKYGIDKPTRLPEYIGAVQSMKLYNESRWNDAGNTGSEYPVYPQDLIENYPSLHAGDPYRYPDYDWQNNGLDDFASTQSHQLNYTVGTEKLRTKASFGYVKSDYLYNSLAEEGACFQRINGRVNNDATINKYISGAIDFHFSREIDKEGAAPRTGSTLNNKNITFNPLYIPFWEDGRATEGRNSWNNHAILKYGGFNNLRRNRIGGKMSIEIKPLEGLGISAVLAPDYLETKRKNWSKAVPYTAQDNPNVITGYVDGAKTTSLAETRNESYNITSQLLINYATSIKKHNLNLMAGYENSYSFSESLYTSSDQFELSVFPYLNMGNKNYLSNNGNANELAYRSFFGRIIYNYNNKYLFQGNLRYDGSSRFNKNYRWGAFPSISMGWVLSEERFMQNLPSLSFLKIRSSWGILGNDRIGNYPYQSSINFGSNLLFLGDEVISVLNSSVVDLAIEDITWETTETFGVGLDAYFFNNKLRFTGDYYIKTTLDMLLALEIPDFMGVSNPDQNTGKMETKGWEIDLGYSDRIGEIDFSFSANLSDFKSVMGDLGGTEFLGNQIKIEGSEFDEWYGYKSDGLFQTEEELNNSPTLNSTVRIGDIKLLDVSGSDGIPDGEISPDYDRVLLGGSLPRFLYGGNIGLGYKNIDLSIVFQGVGKQNVRIDPDMIKSNISNDEEISKHYVDNYWSMYNTEEENLKAQYPRFTNNAISQMFAFSDYWLFNGAYFRLKNITIGYNIPPLFLKTYKIQNARLYTSVSNLFSIDNFYPGCDPESSPGSYWTTRTFLVGLSVTF